jgi:putative transposase
MPRRARVFVEGLSLHVMKRGNNRNRVFQQDEDYAVFLGFLKQAIRRWPIALHAYVLMPNHFHLVMTPGTAVAVSAVMKELCSAYTRYFNREYRRIGTIWNGRYRGIAIEDDRYWLTCLRYVELNPVRAGIVRTPDEYHWSSYAAHATGSSPGWLTKHSVYQALGHTAEERAMAYRAVCGTPLPSDHLYFLR